MQDITKFVGLAVSKAAIAVAVADDDRDAPRYFGQIPNTSEAMRKLVSKLKEGDCRIRTCYEAGPRGVT